MMEKHPSFVRAEGLAEPLRSHFPKSVQEAQVWHPIIRVRALATCVLVVAQTRIECAWSVYIDAVPGHNHDHEYEAVLRHGAKLSESLARHLFPEFTDVPYAR